MVRPLKCNAWAKTFSNLVQFFPEKDLGSYE